MREPETGADRPSSAPGRNPGLGVKVLRAPSDDRRASGKGPMPSPDRDWRLTAAAGAIAVTIGSAVSAGLAGHTALSVGTGRR